MSKKLVVVLSAAVLMAACGNNGETKATENKDTAAAAPAAAPATSANSDKALELIAGSDCTTCHRMQKESSGATIGPAYSDVAAKYAPAADTTIDRLVKKVISGGSGVWGTVPMTPHPAMKADDVRTIVTYIMTLKK
ncbi:MAG: c-type cytochrome [Bacteroidetes bacterium]|nr:c-type cytochrome [Bacteroidota bacterium]